MTTYELRPIGRIESPLVDRAAAPKQGFEGAPDAWLVFAPDVAEGLRDLKPGDEVWLLTWLDRARRESAASAVFAAASMVSAGAGPAA